MKTVFTIQDTDDRLVAVSETLDGAKALRTQMDVECFPILAWELESTAFFGVEMVAPVRDIMDDEPGQDRQNDTDTQDRESYGWNPDEDVDDE
jgi:hypothetical protein